MKRSSKRAILSRTTEWEQLAPGLSRQILGWDNQVMMVKVKFDKGAEGSPHQHFHTQTTYVAKGTFEFSVGEEKKVVKEGDGVYIPPNILHGALCLEEGILIDVFSPVREDFLEGSGVSYFGDK